MIIVNKLVCNYAEAIFCSAADRIEKVQQEIQDLYLLTQRLHEFFNQKLFSDKYSQTILAECIRGLNLDIVVTNLFTQLIRSKKLELLADICKYLPILVLDKSGITEVEVKSTKILSDDEAQSIEEYVKSCINRNIMLKKIIDPTLLGGMVISFDTFLFDASVTTKLKYATNCLSKI
jgi:F-type H+-transporting ATPase subunit delta